MKHKLSTNSNSVLNSGLTDDYRKAICEYIWNGFDAGANCVEIRYHANEIGGVDDLFIIDNGSGINYDTLEFTFGAFLDSQKKSTFQRTSEVRGKKGKGRFSFNIISAGAQWKTLYKDQNGQLKKFDITIYSIDRAAFETSDILNVSETESQKTGTVVHFLGMRSNLSEDHFIGKSFKDELASEFAWFLILNKSKNYIIKINDEILDYNNIVGDTEDFPLVVDGITFDCAYIRWKKKIGDKYYYYLMNTNRREVCKIPTSFNNKSNKFHHSVYVTSCYFNNFIYEKDLSKATDGFVNQGDDKYKTLIKQLRSYLIFKEKEFLRSEGATQLVAQYEKDGVLPKFPKDKRGEERKKNLIEVIQGIYSIQPKIFLDLEKEQQQTMVGFLNLLLDSNERDNIITIIDNAVKLTPEEREELASLLKVTTLSRINSAVRLLKNRFLVVEKLKQLIYDLEIFTNERDHIQAIIEENYWLFGEQYNLVSADKPFTNTLLEYTYCLDGVSVKGEFTAEDGRRRPDIFMCRLQDHPGYPYSSILEENVMVELKRPSVVIGKEQYRQIEDYKDIILSQPKFQSQRRKWIFIIVGKEVDDYIKEKYKTFSDKNRPLLVNYQENFEIYAMTWDDVFLTYDRREKYITDKLNFDRQVLHDEIEEYKKSRVGADCLTNDILSLDTK